MVVKLAVQVTMEPGPDVPDKATKVDNKEVQPEMGPTKVDNKEIQPEMGPGPGEETQGEKVPSRVRLRTKTPDESFNSMKEEEDEKAAGTSSKEPGGATKAEAYGGGQELAGTSGTDGELTSTAVTAHNRHASRQPHR
jgi:hypothetical protein